MSSVSLSRIYSTFLLSGLTALASATTAWASAPEASNADMAADYMPHGGFVSAPTGFLEMCMRSPSDCARSPNYDPIKIKAQASLDLAEKFRLALSGQGGNVETASVSTDTPPVTAPTSAPLQTPAPAPVISAPVMPEPRLLSWSAKTTPPAANSSQISYSGASDAEPSFREAAYFTLQSLHLASLTPSLLAADAQPGALENDMSEPVSTPVDQPQALIYSRVSYSAATTSMPLYNWHGLLQPRAFSAAPTDNRQRDYALHNDNHDSSDRASPQDYVRIDADDQEMALIRSINTEVNHIIRQDTDAHIYHVADYWTAPGLYRGARGDCEDIALQKRRELINAGIPADALSIAIVKTYRGEDHAVLLIATRQGDYVLDSLAYDVRPWRKTDYTWIARQAPGDDINWVSLLPANNTLRQAKGLRIAANW